MKFKAAVLTEIDKPLDIKTVETTPLKTGQVLVRNVVSGLCGAQLQEISGLKGNSKFLPHLLGHEGCGIVEEIGLGVTNVKIGDKVIMHWRVGKGIEAPFPSYVLDDRIISSGKVTTLSEYSIVSENRLTTVPFDTPNELCALLGCGLSTALGTIENETDLRLGESVLILGSGGVGLNLIQASKIRGSYPTIGADIFENKRSLAMNAGADLFVSSGSENFSEILTKMLKSESISSLDVIIDTTGNSEMISSTIPFLSERGRFIMVGQPKPGESLTILNANQMFFGQGRTIKATQGGRVSPSEDLLRYVNLYRSGLLNIDKMISHRFSLDEINLAIETLKSGNAARIMIQL